MRRIDLFVDCSEEGSDLNQCTYLWITIIGQSLSLVRLFK